MLLLLAVLALPGCSRQVSLRLEDHADSFTVILKNDSSQPIDVVGDTKLGVPPSLASVQWEVSSNGRTLTPCALVDNGLRSVRVEPGTFHKMETKKALIEQVFCVPAGQYEVSASYVHSNVSIQSNKLRATAKPRAVRPPRL